MDKAFSKIEFSGKISACAAVLVGGESTRLGIDKSLLKFRGKYLATIIYNRLSDCFNNVYFVSDRYKKYSQFGVPVFEDIIPDKGALGGIYSALTYADEEYCFITACDLPYITKELIEILWLKSGRGDIMAPIWLDHIEPLVAFYHRRCLQYIEKALEDFWYNLNVSLLDMIPYYSRAQLEKLFFNINTPEDYQKALTL